MNHWLLKSEPHKYSYADLVRDKKTGWDGVRNHQAKNFLKTMKVGDLALIYHSGDERRVMGVATVTKSAYPDPDPKKPGEWVQVDLKTKKALPQPVSLSEIKATPSLKNMKLIKQSRLSVMPVTKAEFDRILKMGES